MVLKKWQQGMDGQLENGMLIRLTISLAYLFTKNISMRMAKKITCCSSSWGKSPTAHTATHLPKIEFSLAATCPSIKEHKEAQNPGLRAFPSKTGCNQNMKRAMVFGPKRCGRAKFHHHRVEQGINKVIQLIGKIGQGSQLGEMMMMEAETT